jgi:hypothetical protein
MTARTHTRCCSVPCVVCDIRSGGSHGECVRANWDVDDLKERADGIESSSLLTTIRHSVVVSL